MKQYFQRLLKWLSGLSMRTGMMVALCCALCYAISFLQFMLPISIETKGVLWIIFFGLAKTCQYSAIAILGKEGWRQLKRSLLRRRK